MNATGRMRIKSEALIYRMTANGGSDATHFSKAKIIRVERRDISFESDIPLHAGDNFYLGVKIVKHEIGYYKQLVARIMKRTDLRDSFYPFGYTAKCFNSRGLRLDVTDSIHSEAKSSPHRESQDGEDPREHPRMTCNRKIMFSDGNKEYPGVIVNICQRGAFLSVPNNLFLKQSIEIVNKASETGNAQRLSGQVIRIDQSGVAVKFTRTLNHDSAYSEEMV